MTRSSGTSSTVKSNSSPVPHQTPVRTIPSQSEPNAGSVIAGISSRRAARTSYDSGTGRRSGSPGEGFTDSVDPPPNSLWISPRQPALAAESVAAPVARGSRRFIDPCTPLLERRGSGTSTCRGSARFEPLRPPRFGTLALSNRRCTGTNWQSFIRTARRFRPWTERLDEDFCSLPLAFFSELFSQAHWPLGRSLRSVRSPFRTRLCLPRLSDY